MNTPRPLAALAVVSGMVLLGACSDSATERSLAPSNPTEDLDQAVAELVAMPGGPPGAIVVVQDGAERTVHAAGVADIDTGVEPSADDHMRIASVAKAFSGATALALVDQGVLSLDDTIAERLPDLPAEWGDVTLRQLLNHTSGLPDVLDSNTFVEALRASPDEPPPGAELVALVADDPLVFPPGTRYVYSNTDNLVAALMIEEATGRTYEQVLQTEVLDPLGLSNTSLPVGAEVPEPFIHGYETSEDSTVDDVTSFPAGWSWASGGIVSTPSDLNTFIRGYVGGALYSDATREEQQALFMPGGESEPPGPGTNSASMSLFRYETPCGTVYGHSGNTLGFTQYAVASPSGERSATISINLQRTPDDEEQARSVFLAFQHLAQVAICAAMDGG